MNSGAHVALGVSTAVAWGTGDFCGGLAARRAPALAIALFGQASSCLALGLVVLAMGEPAPSTPTLNWAIGAGFGSALGTSTLYAALAAGSMSLAAPIAALITALIPVGAAFILQGAPGPTQATGLLAAALAVWLLAGGDGVLSRRALAFAVLAGTGFGISLLCTRQAGQTAIAWPLFVTRLSGTFTVGMLALLIRTRMPLERRPLALGVATGLFDSLGNGLFVLATRIGRLDVSSALAALYPASTLLLARVVLGERTSARQRLGMACALGAVVLLSR